MSRYDGLIIPRSYSEYINKTDAATLQQALQLSGVIAQLVAAGDNRAVSSNAVADILSNYINNEKYLVTNKTENPFANTDLNTLTQNGVYFVNTNDSVRDNYPSGTNGVLYVYSHAVGANVLTRQIFYRTGTINTNDFNFFTRQISSSGTIGNWSRLVTEKDLTNYGTTTISDCNTPFSLLQITDSNTLNTPYKQGLTTASTGLLISSTLVNTNSRCVQLFIVNTSATSYMYKRHKTDATTWTNWVVCNI